MSFQKNPFVDLYVTESISADTFVKVFSTALLDEADTLALYQPGNVLLIGLQGSGKTALLNLLKPEVLIAYRRANRAWPLPDSCARFISAGINLSKSGAMDFGQRSIEAGDGRDSERRFAMYFADFLNYWVVDDLLQSIETLYSAGEAGVRDFLDINAAPEKLDQFATTLSSKSCWHHALVGVKTYASLRQSLESRIMAYRSFLNYNTDEIPQEITHSKTSAGDPISVTVDILRTYGILPKELPVLIRIDQFEDLMGLEEAGDHSLRIDYRAVIFKMMGTRDSRLSYRVGVRPYAVQQDFRMLGTASAIEERRNYTVVDIDSVLRRKEHSPGIFPKFAASVFAKRLAEANYKLPNTKKSLISYVFGSKPSPEERSLNYAKEAVEGIILNDPLWPIGAYDFLSRLAKTSPVSAKLGEAWLRQQINRKPKEQISVEKMEWEKQAKRWWKKERIEQALLQIAAARRQRMVWSGDSDILTLSGGNILVFLSICQLIWAEYLRAEGGGSLADVPEIHSQILQDLGIQQASEYWYRKLRADPNGGDDRHRFVSVLANDLRNNMRDDKRMSYPGANGFSLSDRSLEEDSAVGIFLDQCTAYGVLTMSRHTPKTASRGESKKWYLFPILSPYFQIPAAHTKEPVYAAVSDVREWLSKAKVGNFFKADNAQQVPPVEHSKEQLALFPTRPVSK